MQRSPTCRPRVVRAFLMSRQTVKMAVRRCRVFFLAQSTVRVICDESGPKIFRTHGVRDQSVVGPLPSQPSGAVGHVRFAWFRDRVDDQHAVGEDMPLPRVHIERRSCCIRCSGGPNGRRRFRVTRVLIIFYFLFLQKWRRMFDRVSRRTASIRPTAARRRSPKHSKSVDLRFRS